jgi:hypothetical protein
MKNYPDHLSGDSVDMTRFLIRYWTLYPAAGGIVRIPPLCTAVDVFVPVSSGHLLDAIMGAKGGRAGAGLA